MRAVRLIFIVAGVWAITGVIVGLGLSSYFSGDWMIECGSLNLGIGMVLLQLVTRSEAGRKLFYEGVREEDEINLGIIMLWTLPVSMALTGVLWWLMGKFSALP